MQGTTDPIDVVVSTTAETVNKKNNEGMNVVATPWKIGHTVLSSIHILWLIMQIIYHTIMMISFYIIEIPGYATGDLILILICFFFLLVDIAGLVVMYIPSGKMTPLIESRFLKLNTMANVIGMNYFTFLYLLMWVTGKCLLFTIRLTHLKEFSHAPFTILTYTTELFQEREDIYLILFHPGITIVPFVIQLAIGMAMTVTSLNYYLFMEPVYAKIIRSQPKKIKQQVANNYVPSALPTPNPFYELSPTPQPHVHQPQVYQPQVYQPQVFQPQVYQPQVFQPQAYQPQVYQPQAYRPNDALEYQQPKPLQPIHQDFKLEVNPATSPVSSGYSSYPISPSNKY